LRVILIIPFFSVSGNGWCQIWDCPTTKQDLCLMWCLAYRVGFKEFWDRYQSLPVARMIENK